MASTSMLISSGIVRRRNQKRTKKKRNDKIKGLFQVIAHDSIEIAKIIKVMRKLLRRQSEPHKNG